MSVTLADIARELGLSKMTVSRAINDDPLVNAKTRARVLEVSRRLNYQPNHFARALVTNRSFLIGVIVPDLMHSYFAEIMHGIGSFARSASYQIVIGNTEEHVALVRELGATPHVAQNDTHRRSAIDGRTTRHPGYEISLSRRWLVEKVFGWLKQTAGMRQVKLRGLEKVQWLFVFSCAAYNVLRIPKLRKQAV